MKKLRRYVSYQIALVVLVGGVVYAATSPSLGIANSFGILASTYTNTSAGTSITGNLGYTTGPAVTPTVSGTTNASYAQAGIDQGVALSNLNGQLPCTFSAAGPLDLATDITHGPVGVYTPGIYCITGASSIGTGGITLNGSGTYVFRITGALTTVANSVVTLSGGASACDVWWTPGAATTLGANSTFIGTVIDDSGITVGSTVIWTGRALAFGGTVTTNSDTITVPTCTISTPVVNNTGGVFPFPPLISVEKIPSPLALPSGPGMVTYTYTVTNPGRVAMSYVKVTDNKCAPVIFVSGDTNSNRQIEVNEVWKYSCTMQLNQTTTNIVTVEGFANGVMVYDTAEAIVAVGVGVTPPLIHLLKVPSVFTLPVGGGVVTYRYTVTNPGVVPLSDVSISDDKCTGLPTRVVGHPGDINHNDLLEPSEAWSFVCTSNLTKTTTNTAVASGHANGFTVTDIARATVVVPEVLGASIGFPNTGYEPNNTSEFWGKIFFRVLLGLVVVFSLFYFRGKMLIEARNH